MKVKVDIELHARDVLLMHKYAPSLFIEQVYAFMVYHGCSRTKDELQSISTDELLKDMWYLGISPNSVMDITRIEGELLCAMMHTIERLGGEDAEFDDLFHAYVQVCMDSDEWENSKHGVHCQRCANTPPQFGYIQQGNLYDDELQW